VGAEEGTFAAGHRLCIRKLVELPLGRVCRGQAQQSSRILLEQRLVLLALVDVEVILTPPCIFHQWFCM
jgi:hypothetical protein